MRENIFPRVVEQIHREFIFLKEAQQATKQDLTGESITVKMEIGKAVAIEAQAAHSGVFPDALETQYASATIPLARMLGTIEIPRELMLRATKNSLVQPLKRETLNAYWAFKQRLNGNFLRDTSMALGVVQSFSASTADTVTLYGPDGCRFLHPGQVVDFKRAGEDVTNGVDATVIAITGENTFTINITGTLKDGDVMTLKDSYGNGAQGLGDIIGTGTFQGIEGASNYYWQANVDTNSGTKREFKPKDLKNLLTKAARRRGQTPTLMIAAPEVADAAAWVLMGQRLISNEANKWEGFWPKVEWEGHTIIVEPDMPANTLYGVNKQDLLFGYLGSGLINLVDVGGTQHLGIDSSTSRRKNTLVMYFDSYPQLAAIARCGHFKYGDVYGLDDSGAAYDDYGGIAVQ